MGCGMNIALILSGGVGSRMPAEVPKQYIRVGGRMILTRCAERLFRHPLVHAVQIVAAREWQDAIRAELPEDGGGKWAGFSQPGENRQSSIYHGLLDISRYAGPEDTVLVHDAVRPCVSEGLITACFAAMEGHDGVLPVLPMTDTVYYSEGGQAVDRLLRREKASAG